jgi:hypothetical protein
MLSIHSFENDVKVVSVADTTSARGGANVAVLWCAVLVMHDKMHYWWIAITCAL